MTHTLERVLRFGVLNYVRNGWLSIAATFVLAMTLFIVSTFTLEAYVTRLATRSIQNKLDMAVYINDTPSEDQVAKFVADLRQLPEVKDVVYLNKDQVIAAWNTLPVDDRIKNQINPENNPLPRTVKIKLHDPTQFDAVHTKIQATDFATGGNVRKLSYGDSRPIIQSLITRSQKAIRDGLIVSAIFIIIAIIFVYNTIRIIIHFRQDEITVMKLVGATDSFIRGPFIVEGALYGLLAGLLTLPALYLYIRNGLPESSTVIATPDTLIARELMTVFQANISQVGGSLILFAIALAVICSWFSVRHHLKR